MQNITEDLNVQKIELISPQVLSKKLPSTHVAHYTVSHARDTIHRIMQGIDSRLLVIVGPCSIHDVRSAREYAALLADIATQLKDKLFIVMRVYLEKPRTLLGWKGLISDPNIDGSNQINKGLHLARKLLIDINNLGLATATEFLDPIIPQYISDQIAWCAVGARTSESQMHRELASSLSIPVGFKNNTDGNIKIAIDAIRVAAHTHSFITINEIGAPIMIRTNGNKNCHLVLRGSYHSPNYTKPFIEMAADMLNKAHLTPSLIVDCSHANSMRNFHFQKNVINDLIKQISLNNKVIRGVMIESHLIEGNQAIIPNQSLTYGKSITDACMGWEDTVICLKQLAEVC